MGTLLRTSRRQNLRKINIIINVENGRQ